MRQQRCVLTLHTLSECSTVCHTAWILVARLPILDTYDDLLECELTKFSGQSILAAALSRTWHQSGR